MALPHPRITLARHPHSRRFTWSLQARNSKIAKKATTTFHHAWRGAPRLLDRDGPRRLRSRCCPRHHRHHTQLLTRTDPVLTDPPYRDVERDGRHDVRSNDCGADPGPGDRGYRPTPDEYGEERAWRK